MKLMAGLADGLAKLQITSCKSWNLLFFSFYIKLVLNRFLSISSCQIIEMYLWFRIFTTEEWYSFWNYISDASLLQMKHLWCEFKQMNKHLSLFQVKVANPMWENKWKRATWGVIGASLRERLKTCSSNLDLLRTARLLAGCFLIYSLGRHVSCCSELLKRCSHE